MKKIWLKNKTVVITGANGGLGFSIAKMLIEKYDCKILGIARNEQKFLDSIKTLDKKENFKYFVFDVNDKNAWQNFIKYLEDNAVQVDMLINNAGFMLPFKKFEDITNEEIEDIINTNFKSVVMATKLLIDNILKSSTPAIINISSSAGLCAVVGESMYSATKYAVRGFTETLIQDYYKKIYVAGIYPGFIKTDILSRMSVNDKENKLINKVMMPIDKATKKIVKAIKKRRRRVVFGFDGRSLAFFGKHFGIKGARLISKVLKASKLDVFKDI